jgi:hypothetical protein
VSNSGLIIARFTLNVQTIRSIFNSELKNRIMLETIKPVWEGARIFFGIRLEKNEPDLAGIGDSFGKLMLLLASVLGGGAMLSTLLSAAVSVGPILEILKYVAAFLGGLAGGVVGVRAFIRKKKE